MAFKIPTTIEGKKLFFVLFFKSTSNPYLLMNTELKLKCIEL